MGWPIQSRPKLIDMYLLYMIHITYLSQTRKKIAYQYIRRKQNLRYTMQRTPKAGGTTAKKTSTKTREKRFKGLKPVTHYIRGVRLPNCSALQRCCCSGYRRDCMFVTVVAGSHLAISNSPTIILSPF